MRIVLCPLVQRYHANGSAEHLFSHSLRAACLPLHDLYLDTNGPSLKGIHQLISKLLAAQTWSIPLCHAPEEADSWSSSQWDISISGLFFILSIFHSQRRGTLMSLKSHYGCCSEPAKADFLWFCSGAEEMREAESPPSKIQKDMAGHEGVCQSLRHGTDCFIPSWRCTYLSDDSRRCRSRCQWPGLRFYSDQLLSTLLTLVHASILAFTLSQVRSNPASSVTNGALSSL